MFQDIEDMFGKAAAVLINSGHPRSEVAKYSWPTMELFLTDLAERNGASPAAANDEAENLGDGRTRRPMSQPEYFKMMGVTDPDEIAKLTRK